MIEIQFVPLTPLIIVDVLLEHRRKHIAKMIFDTGATFTTITPEIALKLGFDLQKTPRDQIVYTADKAISAFRFIITSVYLQSERVSDHEVRCMSLPKGEHKRKLVPVKAGAGIHICPFPWIPDYDIQE